MNRQQKFLNTLLKEIHEICVKNDITYYIAGGTLIGALRHEGFLPWDDDADVFMTDTEFEKFKKACETDLPANRALRTPDELTYRNALPRYVSTDTTSYHSYQILDRDDAAGEVIDVFVLYPISGKNIKETIKGYTYDTMLLSELINYSAVFGRRYGVAAKDFQEILDIRDSQGEKAARDYLEKRLESYVDPNGEYYIMRWCGVPLVYEKQWFDEVELVKYEDFEVMAPTTSNMYLTAHYGDEWCYLPPASEEGVHNTTGSLDFSYKDALTYLDEDSFDFKQLIADQYKRKLTVLEASDRKHALNDHSQRIRGVMAKLELQHAIDKDPKAFNAALRAHDGAALAPFFAKYFEWQLSRPTIGRDDWNGAWRWFNPYLGQLEADLFQGAIESLMWTERIGMAWRLLFIKEEYYGGLTEQLESLKEDILTFRKAVNLFQAHKLDQGEALVDGLLSKYPELPGFTKLKACFLDRRFETDKSTETLAKLEKLVAESLVNHPEDGFYLKYQADKLQREGKQEEATELYKQAAEHTYNGIVLLDIKHKIDYVPTHQRGRGEKAPLPNRINTSDALEGAPQRLDENGKPLGNDLQIALFDLLTELTGYLDKEGLGYVLDNTLCRDLFGFGMLPKNIGTYTIYMKAADLRSFIQKFEQNPWKNRALEHMGTNCDLNSRHVSFVNTASTWYNLRQGKNVKFPGLKITIKLLETPGAVSKMDALLGIGWSRTCYKSNKEKPTSKEKLCETVVRCFGHGSARASLGRHLLNSRLKAAEKESGKYLIRNASRRANVFDESLIDDVVTRTFAGVSFKTVRNLEAFESELPFFLTQGIPGSIKAAGDVYASATVPFKEFLAKADITDELLAERQRVFQDEANDRAIFRGFKDCFAKTAAAIGVKQIEFDLSPRKSELMDLEKEGKYEELYAILLDYRTLALQHPNAAFLDFDPELFGILVRTLRAIKTRECRTILKKNQDTISHWKSTAN